MPIEIMHSKLCHSCASYRPKDREREVQAFASAQTATPVGQPSLLSPLPPSSGVFPTVPPTRVGLRPGSPGRSSTIGGPDCAQGSWILLAMPVDPLKAAIGTRDRSRWAAHDFEGRAPGNARPHATYPGMVYLRQIAPYFGG